MKVAFVNQPIDMVLPPRQNSIGLWTYEVGRRLVRTSDVTAYIPGNLCRAAVKADGVEYRVMPARIASDLLEHYAS